MQLNAFSISFLLALSMTPLVIIFSRKSGLLDHPKANSIHTRPMPYLGGAVIFAVFFAVSLIFKRFQGLLPFFLGSAIILAAGFYDDLRGMNWRGKIAAQALAVLVLIFSGASIENMRIPLLGTSGTGLWSWPVTMAWFLLMINLVNIMDGLDGLAAGLCAITLFSMLFYIRSGGLETDLFILLGAVTAFLIFNFYPARIFLGNSGSMFLGFSLAYFSITGCQKSTALTVFFLPLAVLAIHLFDAIYAVYRRLKTGANIFRGDKKHLHHLLLDRAGEHRRAILIFYLVSSVLAFVFTRLCRYG